MEAVSRTAQWTAAARAIESEREDRLFHDRWARTVAGETGFALLDRYQGAGIVPFVTVRTKYMDEAVLHTVRTRGIRQVAFMAAGMDTRPERLDWPEGTTVFELDHPALLEAKAELLAPEDYRPRCDRRTVPVDLTADWRSAASEAGLDSTKPTLWVAEGLFFFLEESAVRGLLAAMLESSAAASMLVGDFVGAANLTNPLAGAFLGALKDDGNPWLFGTDEPEAFLRENGWTPLEVRQPGEDGAGFGRWQYPVPPRDRANVPRSFLFTAEVA